MTTGTIALSRSVSPLEMALYGARITARQLNFGIDNGLYKTGELVADVSNYVMQKKTVALSMVTLYLWQQIMPGDYASNTQALYNLTGGRSDPLSVIKVFNDFGRVIVANPTAIRWI